MSSIQINSDEKRIAINDDPERVIVFNPSDVLFAERFYRLMDEFQQKLTEYKRRFSELEKNQEADEFGIPKNFGDRIHLAVELCNYMRDEIDKVFGAGTSQKAFGDDRTLDMFMQFFNGLTPYIQRVRSEIMEKYTGKKSKRGAK